jgi:hypothetical protein
VGDSISTHITEEDHVDGHDPQFLDDGVVNCLVGKVHTRLQDCKRRLSADGVSSYFQVLIDGPNMLVGAIGGLLYN